MPKADARLKAVAFDLDGTLIDTLPDLAAAVNLTLSMLGTPPVSELRVRALVGHGVEQLVARALRESLGDRPEHPAQQSAALTLFRRLYAQSLFTRSRVYQGVEQTLRSFSEAGVTLCCITNKEGLFALPLLEAARLSGYLAFSLCAASPEERKPSPAMLLAACARLGIKPAEMLYVGDSRIDVAAARAAGCPVVAVTYGYDKSAAFAESQPDAVIDSATMLVSMFLPPRGARFDAAPCTTGTTS